MDLAPGVHCALLLHQGQHRDASPFVLGLAMVFVPGYRGERLVRGEDITQLQGWKLITPRWWVILGVAFGCGLTDYFLLVA